MAGQPLIATITGIPSGATVNVRSGPSKDFQIALQPAKGTTGLRVIEVQIDGKNEVGPQGKVFQWFRVQFPDGMTGWIRDDLLSVVGDGSAFGYGIFTAPAVPYFVLRMTGTAGTMSAPAVQAAPVVQAAPPVVITPPVVQAAPTVTVTTPTTLPTPTSAGTSTQVTVSSVQTPPTIVPQPTAPQVVAAPQVVVAAPAPQISVSVPSNANVTVNTTGPAMAMCMMKGGARVRAGAGKTNTELTRMSYRDKAQILEIKQGSDNPDLRWVKINYQGKEGWTREDFVRVSGAFGSFGFAEDLYACPAPESWWVRDYDPSGALLGTGQHFGWDHGGTVGQPILAGPKGGFVLKTALCQKCGDAGSSTLEKGFTVGDARIFSDQSWNFGYGHYMIVRYDNALLPASTQAFLNSKGWGGYHAFVMYAHLFKILAQQGQTVAGGQEIAKMGNSGNSEAAHLHLELRFGQDPNAAWATMKEKGLVSPAALFLR